MMDDTEGHTEPSRLTAAMWDEHLDRVRVSRQHAELHEQLQRVEAKLDKLLERTRPHDGTR